MIFSYFTGEFPITAVSGSHQLYLHCNTWYVFHCSIWAYSSIQVNHPPICLCLFVHTIFLSIYLRKVREGIPYGRVFRDTLFHGPGIHSLSYRALAIDIITVKHRNIARLLSVDKLITSVWQKSGRFYSDLWNASTVELTLLVCHSLLWHRYFAGYMQ